MSTAAADPWLLLRRKFVPPELNDTLTAWWLTIVGVLAALAALWPMLLTAAGDSFGLLKGGEVTVTGWAVLGGIGVLFLLAGAFVAIGLLKRNQSALGMLRIGLIVWMVVGLAVLGGLIFLMMGTGKVLQPVPILGGVLLILVALLPFFFGVLGLSLSRAEAVKEYLAPIEPETAAVEAPAEEEMAVETMADETVEEAVAEVTDEAVGEDRAAASAAEMLSESALAEDHVVDVAAEYEPGELLGPPSPARGTGTDLEKILEEEGMFTPGEEDSGQKLDAPSTATGAKRKTQITPTRQETKLRPEEPERRATMIQPAEASERKATMIAPSEAEDVVEFGSGELERAATEAPPPKQPPAPPPTRKSGPSLKDHFQKPRPPQRPGQRRKPFGKK